MYQFVGDFKNSHLHYEKSLSINPNDTQIYRLMSRTKKFKKDDKEFEIFKNKINDKNINEVKKMHLYFALGKAFDDIKDFDNSFLNYKKGNDIKNKLLKVSFKLEKV
jgi:tetratricopeptide (TPR) repeat protein